MNSKMGLTEMNVDRVLAGNSTLEFLNTIEILIYIVITISVVLLIFVLIVMCSKKGRQHISQWWRGEDVIEVSTSDYAYRKLEPPSAGGEDVNV